MTTIYYLSAAGNSLYAAKIIMAKLKENGSDIKLISIDTAMQTGDLRPEGDTGFIMPLHFFALPLLAEDFFKQLDFSKIDYTFAVITCGWHYMSDAFHELQNIFIANGALLKATFYIDMVSIYLPLSDIPPEAKKIRRLQKAAAKTNIIAEKIVQHIEEHDHEYLNFVSRLIHEYVQKHRLELDKDFQADVECNGCGLCAVICPVKNISIVENRPTWQHHCTQCLACLHVCPCKAIDLGSRTKNRQRYRHPEILIKELLQRDL